MLIGNVGNAPEKNTTKSGNEVSSFSLATSENYKDKTSGERVTKTEWHKISAFGKIAEILNKYVTKGSKIYIEGKNKTSSYEKNGVTHYTTKVEVSDFAFLGDKRTAEKEEKNDDLPFDD